MSYDCAVSQYINYIHDLTIESCKGNEILDYFKDRLNIVSKEDCDKPYIKVYKGNRLYFTYYGTPSVNEFLPFLNALVRISNNTIQLDDKEKELASKINGNVKLFVTPGCAKCPIAAELLYQLPIYNEKINLEIVDVEAYEDLGKKYRVLNVPKIILNEKVEVPGTFPLTIILKMLAKGSEQH